MVLTMIITACHNPFSPEKEISPVNQVNDVFAISVGGSDLSDVTCIEGQETVLTVNVKGGENNYTYQWYKNDENSNEGGIRLFANGLYVSG